MYGTAGASASDNTATADWEAAFIAEYGKLPVLAYVKRPTTRPSPSLSLSLSLSRPRLQVVSTEPQSAIIFGKSQDHPAGPF